MENELEVDNRELGPKEQETLRLRVIRVARKNLRANGEVRAKAVAAICECNVSHVSHTWKKYRESGASGLKCVRMGRRPGSGKLTEEEQTQVRKLIVDKTPDQLSNQRKLRFMFYHDSMNAGKQIEFPRRLVAGAT